MAQEMTARATGYVPLTELVRGAFKERKRVTNPLDRVEAAIEAADRHRRAARFRERRRVSAWVSAAHASDPGLAPVLDRSTH